MFNVDNFLNTEVTDSFSTEFKPIPEGEYTAAVSEIKGRQQPSKKDPGDVLTILDIVWTIDDPQLAEELGRNTLNVRQSVFLNLNDQGNLDRDKNQQLGRLRDATGQNQDGQPWNPGMLVGSTAKIKVNHRHSDDGEKVFEDVTGVTRL